MSRKLFAAGCWVLIALGLVHLMGHYGLMTRPGRYGGGEAAAVR